MLQPRASAVILAAIVVSACNRTAKEAPPLDADAANAAVVAWREKHETDYRRDFVSIAGLHILKPGTNTAGSDKTNDIVLSATPPSLGKFVLEGQNVRFEPATGVKVLLKNQPVTAPIDLKADVTHDSDELVIGDVRLAAHVSGDNRSIRVRDPNGPLAKGFLGFTWFPVDAQYRVVGRLIRDAEPRKLKVLNTYNDVDEYSTEGVVEFNLLGQTLRLRPFTTRPKRFYIVFRDASSGQETYATARLLYSDLRDDGTTVLDFNAAYRSALRVQSVHDLPDSSQGESSAREDSGGRACLRGEDADRRVLTAFRNLPAPWRIWRSVHASQTRRPASTSCT